MTRLFVFITQSCFTRVTCMYFSKIMLRLILMQRFHAFVVLNLWGIMFRTCNYLEYHCHCVVCHFILYDTMYIHKGSCTLITTLLWIIYAWYLHRKWGKLNNWSIWNQLFDHSMYDTHYLHILIMQFKVRTHDDVSEISSSHLYNKLYES